MASAVDEAEMDSSWMFEHRLDRCRLSDDTVVVHMQEVADAPAGFKSKAYKLPISLLPPEKREKRRQSNREAQRRRRSRLRELGALPAAKRGRRHSLDEEQAQGSPPHHRQWTGLSLPPGHSDGSSFPHGVNDSEWRMADPAAVARAPTLHSQQAALCQYYMSSGDLSNLDRSLCDSSSADAPSPAACELNAQYSFDGRESSRSHDESLADHTQSTSTEVALNGHSERASRVVKRNGCRIKYTKGFAPEYGRLLSAGLI